jgi:mRNA interferase RelE/StbE
LAWTVEFDPAAAKALSKLDPQVGRRIIAFLRDRVAHLDDPRSIGEALKGDALGEYWKYRLGDFRLIARIVDHRLVILIVRVGHRKAIHRA